jgi:hypothetical protein
MFVFVQHNKAEILLQNGEKLEKSNDFLYLKEQKFFFVKLK